MHGERNHDTCNILQYVHESPTASNLEVYYNIMPASMPSALHGT